MTRDMRGAASPRWKGPIVSITAYHKRVWSARGKAQRCEQCGTTDPSKTYDWANLTGNYGDINDYRRLCRSCHRHYDVGRGSRIGPNAHKTACVNGHPFDEENTIQGTQPNGNSRRRCRICTREYAAIWARRKRAAIK